MKIKGDAIQNRIFFNRNLEFIQNTPTRYRMNKQNNIANQELQLQ